MKGITSILFLLIIVTSSLGQKLSSSLVSDSLASIVSVPEKDNKILLTYPGLNAFIQKRVSNYLTGSSDLSLSKVYAAYTAESDKLNLGFNIPIDNPYTGRLSWILNPIVEADVKKGIATLYKDSVWTNNIRAGFKLTYVVPFGTVNFYKNDALSKRQELKKFREDKLVEIQGKLKPTMTRKERNKKFEELVVAEANYADELGAYTWMQTAWISAWGFMPLTKAENYITPNASQNFEKIKFNLWDINFQLNYLRDYRRLGIFYISGLFRQLNNNAAAAGLMTGVDYNKYIQLPGANPLNFAQLSSNKAYIGDFKEFSTTSLSLQFVYFTPLPNGLVRPGLSLKYEKNKGDYDPTNFKVGLPLTIRGKEKPVNIEIQYVLNDLNNYANKEDHKVQKILGINLGYPILPLYK